MTTEFGVGTAGPAANVAAPRLDVAVVGGAGHVGLPLSLTFAQAGMRVGIYDIAESTLAQIRVGQMPFIEAGADVLLASVLKTDRLELSSEPELLLRAGIVVIVIGTPIDEFLNPSMTLFERAVAQLAPFITDGTLVILRSTVFPGTTAFVAKALAEHGCSADVAFCPERVAEGQALDEILSLPQIIGADDARAGDRAEELFRNLGAQTIRTTSKEAELAKLFTNAWRYMKFAAANQFFMIAHSAGIDYNQVLNAVRQDYPRARDLPGPGFAAGPCLLKDTMQLVAFTSDHFPLGQAAMQINEGVPGYVVTAMERRYGSLQNRIIGILGMAFKANSDDPRTSLSYKLRKLLAWSGARVLCTDPHVPDDKLLPLDQVVRESEILVLGAPHSEYRGLEIGGKDVVDIWGALGSGIQL